LTTQAARSPLVQGFRGAFPLLLATVFLGGAMRGYSAPYFNLFLAERNFSGTLIGTVLSAAALVELLLIPLLSTMADRTRTHRMVFRVMTVGYILACIAMLISPNRWVLFAAVLVVQINLRSTFVYAMQLAFTKMQQHGKTLFGRVRSMSAGGFMVANLTAGAVFAVGQYAALFIAAAFSGLLSIGASKSLPQNTADKPVEKAAPPRSRQFYILLASQFFVTMGIRNGFAFWLLHFQENLGISTAQIALIITLGAVFEIPWFLALDDVLKRRRATTTYTLGALLFGIHWAFMGLVPSFIWVIVLLIPRGVAFAMWNLSLLFRINEISHPKNVATNQALGQITVPSLAALISGAPMGYIYDTFPPVVFFSICCGLLFIGAAIMVVSDRWNPKMEWLTAHPALAGLRRGR
jgi:MFS family permease